MAMQVYTCVIMRSSSIGHYTKTTAEQSLWSSFINTITLLATISAHWSQMEPKNTLVGYNNPFNALVCTLHKSANFYSRKNIISHRK